MTAGNAAARETDTIGRGGVDHDAESEHGLLPGPSVVTGAGHETDGIGPETDATEVAKETDLARATGRRGVIEVAHVPGQGESAVGPATVGAVEATTTTLERPPARLHAGAVGTGTAIGTGTGPGTETRTVRKTTSVTETMTAIVADGAGLAQGPALP